MKKAAGIVIAVLLALNIYLVFMLYNTENVEEKAEVDKDSGSRQVENIDTQEAADAINSLLRHVSLAEVVVENYPFNSSDDVVDMWAQGIMERNGVKQYAAMNGEMRNRFKEYLSDINNTSWVTGSDDLVIEGYEIIEKNNVSDKVIIYKLKFWSGSREYAGNFTVVNNGDNWAMTSISLSEA